MDFHLGWRFPIIGSIIGSINRSINRSIGLLIGLGFFVMRFASGLYFFTCVWVSFLQYISIAVVWPLLRDAVSHLSHSEWTGACYVSSQSFGMNRSTGFNFNMAGRRRFQFQHELFVWFVCSSCRYRLYSTSSLFPTDARHVYIDQPFRLSGQDNVSSFFMGPRLFFFRFLVSWFSQCFFFFFFLQLVLVGLVPHCAGSRNYLNEGTLSKRHGHHWPNDTLPWLSKLPD